jgi:glycosyltransferase involved in cell wall biosynthesis
MLACRLFDLSESSGTRIDRVVALKFPAYLVNHTDKRIWLIHQHRQAYELWSHPMNDLIRYPNGAWVRAAIHRADRQCFNNSNQIFTISNTVSERLSRFLDRDSHPLFPPPRNQELFHCTGAEDFFFYPSRISPAKRQDLVLKALRETNGDLKVIFAGLSDTPDYLGKLQKLASDLGIEKRVFWAGQISEKEKVSLYSRCLGVIFPPLDEDYGFVTLEGMLSSKPIITCVDSGGPTEFVSHEENGLVAEPDPLAVAGMMRILREKKSWAKTLGQEGCRKFSKMNISWDNVISHLTT